MILGVSRDGAGITQMMSYQVITDIAAGKLMPTLDTFVPQLRAILSNMAPKQAPRRRSA